MAETNYRIVWICDECGVEFSSRILGELTWHSWSETTCPNGHRSIVSAKIDTVDHAWDAVQAWFDYHACQGERPWPIPIHELVLGVGRGYASTAISAARGKGYFDKPLSPHLEKVRDHILDAIQTKAAPENLIVAGMFDAQTGDLTRYVGSPDSFGRAIDIRLKNFEYNISDAKRDPRSYGQHLLTELEALAQLIERLDRDATQINEFLADVSQIVKEFEATQRARKEREEQRLKVRQAKARWEIFESIVLLVVGIGLLVWSIGVVKTLWNNDELLFAWLSGIEPSRASIEDAWATRPDEIAADIEGAAIGLGALLLVAAYFLLQIPIFYLLAGLGFLLSFIVYKSLWMLFAGLIMLGIGSYMFYFRLEREKSAMDEAQYL